MSFINTILAGISLSLVGLLVKLYYLRQLVWEKEFQLDGIVASMVSLAKWSLRAIIVFSIYNMYLYGHYVHHLFLIFSILLPSFVLFSQKKEMGEKLDKWFRKCRVRRFLSCPYCKHEQRLFYRELLETDTVCYYLINHRQQQVLLGLYEDEDQLARPFVDQERSFELLVSHFYPYLVPNEHDSVIYGEEVFEVGENCYCANCQAKVNHYRIEYGLILF